MGGSCQGLRREATSLSIEQGEDVGGCGVEPSHPTPRPAGISLEEVFLERWPPMAMARTRIMVILDLVSYQFQLKIVQCTILHG